MPRKEYKMSDDYKQSVARLLDRIKERDRLLDYVNVRPFPPDVRKEKLRLIDQLTRQIDKFEQALAKEYEITQEKRQFEEEIEKDYEELDEMCDEILPELLAYLAEHNPEAHAKIVADLKEIDEKEEDGE